MIMPKEAERLGNIRVRKIVQANAQNFIRGLAFELDAIAAKPETAARFAPAVLREIAAELRATADAAKAGAL